jgi:predicted nucleotidyltransferase
MDRATAIGRVRAEADRLRAAGIAAVYLFGSTARANASPSSDVDLMVDLRPEWEQHFSLIDLATVQQHLTDALGVPVDLVLRRSMHPRRRAQIEADAVHVV